MRSSDLRTNMARSARVGVSGRMLLIGTAGLLVFLGVGDRPASADPPPTSAFNIPKVVCYRVTDIEDSFGDPEMDKFDIEFQFANWSNKEVFQLRIDFTSFSRPGGTDPKFTSASVDPSGRPIGPGNDDANFPAGDTFPDPDIPATKTGLANLWNETSTMTGVLFTRTATPGLGVSPRDILGVDGLPGAGDNAAKTAEACALVPGCVVTVGFPGIANGEYIDNGTPLYDGNVDNTMDGFVLTIDEFDPGDYASFNWFLVDINGNPVGVPGNGNAFGFGTLTLYRQVATEDGDGLWGCNNQGCPGSNTGTSGSSDVLFDNSAASGATFQLEAGLGIVAPFRNPSANVFNASVNTKLVSTLNLPALGATGLISVIGLMLLVGAFVLVRTPAGSGLSEK